MPTTTPETPTTPQEHVLAAAMLYQVGSTAVRYTLGPNGERFHSGAVTPDDFNRLATAYAREPKEPLAWAREALFAISTDRRMSLVDRDSRLDRYLDAYSSLTLKLDHAAF